MSCDDEESAGRSVPPGGPATINGILYQLLWSLLSASRARIKSVSTNASGKFEEVFLTLEPAGGGGDLVVTEGPRRIVEQLKARPDGGKWSLREVVEDVIPDLYLGCSDTETNSTFRFVTEGRMGRWESVYKFFQSLRRRTFPLDDPISGLDGAAKLSFGGHKRAGDDKAFWNKDSYTEATMFECIVAEVRKRKTVRECEDVWKTQRKLWRLLGNFEFFGGQDVLQLQREIDSHLLALVDHHEEIPQIRDAMALDLARRATAGGAEIEVLSFFRDHGLDAVPLSDWSRLRANATRQVDTYLELRAYDADLDVRSSRAVAALDDWPKTTPILAVSGESGQGKSWRAYRMAVEARPLPQIVVTIDATGNADST
ncbi:MAG: hypothetical protein IH899_14170, partial [Planctomycetes bacterium]|nr:hypothetical protein [Planctomycetota bacterium]